MKVGVVSWIPSDYQALPWWRSSDRAEDLLTETGYLYEFLLNSGRGSVLGRVCKSRLMDNAPTWR